MGAAVAIRGPRSRGGPPARGGDRCWQWRALRRRAAGPRFTTGAPVRVFCGGPASSGGLVTELWSKNSGYAVDGSVLDPHLRDSRRTWHPSVFSQCTAHEEPAGTQERCAGEPVVAEIAYLWVVEQLVSTAFGDSRASYLLAATGGTRAWSSDVRSTYAESINADERTVGERNQRCERVDRADDSAVDRGRG